MSADLREIVRRVGGEILQGGQAAVVPGPGHSRRDRSLSLKVSDDGKLLWYSFASDQAGAVRQYLGIATTKEPVSDREVQRRRKERQRAFKEVQATKRLFCLRVWCDAVDLMGTSGEVYFKTRGLVGQMPTVLRFHPAGPLSYEAGARTLPAVVAIVHDAEGTARGLHVTAIKADGSGKAMGPKSRRMFGEIHQNAVQLAPVGPEATLAIAEGIETAMAYWAITGIPTWAALSAAGLCGFEPPQGLKTLIIAADGDTAGMDAARALGERLKNKMAVRIHGAGDSLDWNDRLLGKRRNP